MTQSINLTFDFLPTPGHGYLLVPYHILVDLKCAHKITSFSYMDEYHRRPTTVYLEEDCDAPEFIKSAEKLGFNIKINELYQDDDLDPKFLNKTRYRRPFILISPDGFPLEREPTVYTNFLDAEKDYNAWIKQFKDQGYYSSSNHGKIPYDKIHKYADWQEIDYLPTDPPALPLMF